MAGIFTSIPTEWKIQYVDPYDLPGNINERAYYPGKFVLQLVEQNDTSKILYSTGYTGSTVKDYTDAAKADIKKKYKLKRYNVPDLPIATLNEFKNVQGNLLKQQEDEDNRKREKGKAKTTQEWIVDAMRTRYNLEKAIDMGKSYPEVFESRYGDKLEYFKSELAKLIQKRDAINLTRQAAELDKKKQECKTLLGIAGGKKKRKTRSRRVNKRKTKRSF